jgi:hypothetical protein
MVGIINPSKNETLKEYKEEAAKQASGVSPRNEAFGGEIAKDDGSDDSNDDSNDDSSSSDENNSSDGADDEDGAGAFGVPVMSLLAAVGVAFFMA